MIESNCTEPTDVLGILRAIPFAPLHVIDPYKVDVCEAAQKAHLLTQWGMPVLLVGSTDNDDFQGRVVPWLKQLRAGTSMPIITHFPPVPGLGFPGSEFADATLLTQVLNSSNPYYAEQCARESVATRDAGRTQPIRCAALTFGHDEKSLAAVAAEPFDNSPTAWAHYADQMRDSAFDVAYLYSRHEVVPPAACEHFRRRLRPEQLIIVSGGLRTRERIETYRNAGASFIVFGSALEQAEWNSVLADLVQPHRTWRHLRRPRNGAGNGDELARAIETNLAGTVYQAERVLDAYSRDFGSTTQKVPRLVVGGVCEQDVAHVLSTCSQASIPVSVWGRGQSYGGQSLSKGGVLLANADGSPEIEVLSNGDVEVTTRTCWRDLELTLYRHSRAMPVLTNHLACSVGGTLSVGGYGQASVVHGGQVDQVLKAKLLLADGRTTWCSSSEHSDLFHYGIASLGQLGYIERVVMRTVPYRPWTRLYVRRFSSLRALVASTTWMAHLDAPAVDSFMGQHYAGQYLSTFGVRTDDTSDDFVPARELHELLDRDADKSTERDYQTVSLRKKRRTPWSPYHHFVWADYSVDVTSAEDFAEYLQRTVIDQPIYRQANGRLLVLAVRHPERRTHFPFAPLSSRMQGIGFGFGLYLRVPRSDGQALTAVRDIHRSVLSECFRLGGRPYLAGWYDVDDAGRKAVYGIDYDKLRSLRRRVDPAGSFNRGLFFMDEEN